MPLYLHVYKLMYDSCLVKIVSEGVPYVLCKPSSIIEVSLLMDFIKTLCNTFSTNIVNTRKTMDAILTLDTF